jgi:hypothetical protein
VCMYVCVRVRLKYSDRSRPTALQQERCVCVCMCVRVLPPDRFAAGAVRR